MVRRAQPAHRFEIFYGLEVECGINHNASPTSSISIGSYHNGDSLDSKWDTEGDDSIHNMPHGFRGAEFVSHVFRASELPAMLSSLKSHIDPNGDTMRNIVINTTCGAHIHFSVRNPIRGTRHLYRKVPIQTLAKIRKLAHERIKSQLPQVYPSFEGQYNRDYAQVCRDMHSNYHGERRTEFNSTSDKGMEWRSFNLSGVTKWSEIRAMYSIAIGAIEEVIGGEIASSAPFKVKYRDMPKAVESPDPVPEVITRELSEPDAYADEEITVTIESEKLRRGCNMEKMVMVLGAPDPHLSTRHFGLDFDRSRPVQRRFKAGDRVRMNGSTHGYSMSKTGSEGIIESVFGSNAWVKFYFLTGGSTEIERHPQTPSHFNVKVEFLEPY